MLKVTYAESYVTKYTTHTKIHELQSVHLLRGSNFSWMRSQDTPGQSDLRPEHHKVYLTQWTNYQFKQYVEIFVGELPKPFHQCILWDEFRASLSAARPQSPPASAVRFFRMRDTWQDDVEGSPTQSRISPSIQRTLRLMSLGSVHLFWGLGVSCMRSRDAPRQSDLRPEHHWV